MKTNDSAGEVLKVIDSEVVNEKDFGLGESSLDKYFKFSNNKWTVDFVGVVLKKNNQMKKAIISFPKKYFQDELENTTINEDDLNLLEKTMINISKLDNESFVLEDSNNFPVKAYLDICEYYKKYGLYHKGVTKYYKGYGGQIDWKRTVTGSDKILNNGNILFLPFVNKKIEYEDVFITECMNYILTDGYNNFGQFFNIGIKYKKTSKNRIFYDNRAKLIKKLVIIKRSHFKNIEIKLIDNIIKYIKWVSIKTEDTAIVTQKFELFWEVMLKNYLNNFFNYDLIEERIYFDKRISEERNKFVKFSQNKANNIDTKTNDGYLLIDDKKTIAVLLESNSYKMLDKHYNNLNNKELVSYKMLKEYLKKAGKANYKIILGTVLPSFENKALTATTSKCETEGKEIEKHECYLKVKDVMKYYDLKK